MERTKKDTRMSVIRTVVSDLMDSRFRSGMRAVSMVKEAAMMIPDNHYCGWDLAYSRDHGWCMVEANCTAQMGAMQMVTKTGRKYELEELIKQM